VGVTLLNPGGCSDDCYECGAECPIVFFVYDCRLYWYIPGISIPVGDYTVTITKPVGTEVYENISSAQIEDPETGTYSGTITVDSVESDPCTYDYTECTPVHPCCVRTGGINTRISVDTGSYSAYLTKTTSGGDARDLVVIDGFTIDHSSLRSGAMSSGTKTDTNCYDEWGVDEGIAVGTLTIKRYYGGHYTSGDPTCTIPAQYYYQEVTYNVFIRYLGSLVRLIGTATAVSTSTVGIPRGDPPPTLFVGVTYNLTGDVAMLPCHYVLVSGGIINLLPNICGGNNDVIFEFWADVIPL
jgi:hypothetical protein